MSAPLSLVKIAGSGDAELWREREHRLVRMANGLEREMSKHPLTPEQVRDIEQRVAEWRAEACVIAAALEEWYSRPYRWNL